jgi:hypothetical protein
MGRGTRGGGGWGRRKKEWRGCRVLEFLNPKA